MASEDAPSAPAGVGFARTWFAAACAAAVVFGLHMSLAYSRGIWRGDPDGAVPVVLWRGLQAHGWDFIRTWSYSPDNWLLSLVPLDLVPLWLAPGRPEATVLLGWSFFLASVALSAVLLGGLCGRAAGWALAAVLALTGYEALGEVGFLTYPISHNSSMLWGLFALWLAWLSQVRSGPLTAALLGLASGACVMIVTLSDPWAGAAVALPLMLAAAGVAAVRFRQPAGRRALGLAAWTALALVAAQTHLFGLLGFLPDSPLTLTDKAGMATNAAWAFRTLAMMADIVPGADPRSLLVVLPSGLAFLGFLAWASFGALRELPRATPAAQFVLSVCLLSIGGVLVAYLIGRWSPGLYLGRFFPNVFFLGALLIAWRSARAWPGAGRVGRTLIAAYAALFMLSGVASQPRLWLHRAGPRSTEDIVSLGRFLADHHLTYGYGPYWGSYALCMEWYTAGGVVIRPVTFVGVRVARRPGETSHYWYRPADEPPGLKERFLVVANDGEECPSVGDCVAVAIRQFGVPSRQLQTGNTVVLVWPVSIATRIGS
jgi:hypothetical protein